MVPRFYEKVVGHIGIEYLGGIPLLTAQPTNPRSWQFAIKYAADRLVAALLLVLVSPVLLAASIGVWASMGRPIFFRQARSGLDGRVFEILKLRSMRPPCADARGGGELAPGTAPGGVEGDDRRTRVGALPAPHLARRAAAALQRPARRDEPRRPAPRAARVRQAFQRPDRALRRAASREGRASPAGRRCTGCAARPRWPTASSGTTTTSRTGLSGST